MLSELLEQLEDIDTASPLPRLVRDTVAQKFKNEGSESQILEVSEIDLLYYILKSIVVEAKEISTAKTREDMLMELADLREVLEKLMIIADISEQDITKARSIKNETLGSFTTNSIQIK